MDQISDALKAQQSYEVLQKLYTSWNADFKALLFVDLAVTHKSTQGLKLIIDLEGPEILIRPYDEHEKVTPMYVAQLLGKFNADYQKVAMYMERRVKGSRDWERRHGFLWVLGRKEGQGLRKVSDDLVRYVAEEFL